MDEPLYQPAMIKSLKDFEQRNEQSTKRKLEPIILFVTGVLLIGFAIIGGIIYNSYVTTGKEFTLFNTNKAVQDQELIDKIQSSGPEVLSFSDTVELYGKNIPVQVSVTEKDNKYQLVLVAEQIEKIDILSILGNLA